MKHFPCLPLIVERHVAAVRACGEEYKYPEVEVEVFPQNWVSTTLRSKGISGQAMATTYTTVVSDHRTGWYSVFFEDYLAYLIRNPNDIFFDDLDNRKMKPVYASNIYQ